MLLSAMGQRRSFAGSACNDVTAATELATASQWQWDNDLFVSLFWGSID